MIGTAYLRVYQPLSAFSESERASWSDRPEESAAQVVLSSHRWLVTASLAGGTADVADGAFVREERGQVLVCPWRTRLRMLAGLLAFRESVPSAVADAFVPEPEARRAAEELEALSELEPGLRSNIIHANWHVPLRWFAAFDDAERILVEDDRGLRIRYEAALAEASSRLDRALQILEANWSDDAVTEAVRELASWLDHFEGDGIVELDYGTVAGMFTHDELVDDHSAADVWDSLRALGAGDVEQAGEVFGRLTDRWAVVRAFEVVN